MSAEVRKKRPRRRKWQQKWRRFEEGEVRIGAYIVPNLFTTANLFSGFFGMISAINGRYDLAALAIFVSCLFDILDGQVARLTRATSRFGVEYDSLADVVAFGVSPGILMYLWALKPYGRIGWLACFVFVACGALRLARFNVQVETVSKKYFVGLPIPGAASMVAATVLFFHELRLLTVVGYKLPLLLLTYILGFLMVSTVPYYSFKDFEMLKARPFPVFFGILVLVTVIAMSPEFTLFILLVVYLLSGPVIYLVRLYREGRSDRQSPPPEAAMLEDGAGGQERRSGVLAEVVEDDKK
jgi:CDP-diacylglycerol--serine O-phosphatidyltransferase